MARFPAAWALPLMLLFAPAPVLAESAECRMDPADRAWLAGALAQWRTTQQSELRFADVRMPAVYAIDARCTWRVTGGDVTGADGSREGPAGGPVPGCCSPKTHGSSPRRSAAGERSG